VYHCRKTSAKRDGRFAEFCFLCFQWLESQESWRSHAAEHLRPNGGLGPLPLKCNIAHFRHNLIRLGLCPECLGDEDAEPEDRLQSLSRGRPYEWLVFTPPGRMDSSSTITVHLRTSTLDCPSSLEMNCGFTMSMNCWTSSTFVCSFNNSLVT
jgi:hypothetical protein